MNLCLLEECRQLGCFELGIELYNGLKVRHVQLDSLSYLLTPGCFESGLFNEVERQCRDIMRFHSTAARDAGDYAVKAYENGNYMQVMELCEFHSNNLAISVQKAIAKVDHALLQLLLVNHNKADALHYLEQEAKYNIFLSKPQLQKFEELKFNHDFNVGLDWSGENSERTSEMKTTFLNQLKVRSFSLHLLHACFNEQRSIVEEQNISQIQNTLESFQQHCDALTESISASSSQCGVGGAMADNVKQCEKLSLRLTFQILKAGLSLQNKGSGQESVTQTSFLVECKSIINELFQLFQCAPKVMSSSNEAGPADGSSSSSSLPLSPWWLASCSMFMFTTLPVLSLMLQHVMEVATGSSSSSSSSSSKNKNKNKSKNKKAAASSEENDTVSPESLKLVAEETSHLLKDTVLLLNHLVSVLESHQDPSPSSFTSAVLNTSSLPQLITAATATATEVEGEAGGNKFKATSESFFSAMSSSHKLSVSRMVPLLKAKLDILSTL
jgi:hypothetical protein